MMIPMTEESIIEGSGNLGLWEFVWLLLLKQSVSENFLVAPHYFLFQLSHFLKEPTCWTNVRNSKICRQY